MDSTRFLVSLDQMKTYLDFTDDDTDRDAELGLFINFISAMCESYTDRKFLLQELTEYYDGSYNSCLKLRQYPVTSTEATISVWIDSGRDFDDSHKVSADDLAVHQAAGLVYYLAGDWGVAPMSVKVTYSAGFSEVPYDLQLSVQEAVAFFWKRKQDKTWGLQSISKGEASITNYQTSLPDTVKKVWDGYRRQK